MKFWFFIGCLLNRSNYIFYLNYHFIRNLNLYANCIYINSVYYCTLVQSTHGRDFEKFLKFLTRKNLLKVYNIHYSGKAGGYQYYTIFPQVVNFFTRLSWEKPTFFILFAISEVNIPHFGSIYIIRPRFLFSYIFLLLRFYVVEELEVQTLDGKELSEIKLGGYYIMFGDILFGPIRSDRWDQVTKDKILARGVPAFIVSIFSSYFVLDINTITYSKSKKSCLLYDAKRHSWSLSFKY